MFDENSFSLSSFDQDYWLFLLLTPYANLSPRQRVVVRSALESTYSLEVADKVVSFAAVQSISVLDAMQAIGVRTQAVELFIAQKRIKVDDTQHIAETNDLCIDARPMAQDIHPFSTIQSVAALAERQTIQAFSYEAQLFCLSSSRRSLLEKK